MRKFILTMLMCVTVLGAAYAQGEVQFALLKSQQNELQQDVVDALDLKLTQVLNRNNAAAANSYNVFAIEPVLELLDVQSIEGTMQEVTVAKGELTLIARNVVDGTMYYSMVFPLRSSVRGNKDKAVRQLVSGIKVTDAQYTRFIRISRQRIADFYAANCGVILQKAQDLYQQRRYDEAMSYLSAISDMLPCYEQASVLMNEIGALIFDSEPEPQPEPEPVVVERIVQVPVVVEVPAQTTPEPQPEPTPEPAPDPWINCDLTVSVNDLDVKVLRCYGNATQRRITIELEVINRDYNINDTWVYFESAFAADGSELPDLATHSGHDSASTKLPSGVARKLDFHIVNVMQKTSRLSYVEFTIRRAKVTVKDLPVTWE